MHNHIVSNNYFCLMIIIVYLHKVIWFQVFLSNNKEVNKVGDCSQGWPESLLFDSYYTKV